MDKKFLRAYLCITIILIFGAIVFGILYAHDYRDGAKANPYEYYFKDYFSRTEHFSQGVPNAPVIKLIGGICALLLLGYLFVICYKKYRMDSKADSIDLANAFHKISLESGQTEYELFVIAAEEWSITEAQIDKDFRNYMAANVLPYYVLDLVRKNNDRIDESLEKKEEITPTSWWDLVKALLIFPGLFGLLIFLVIIFSPPFFKY